MSRTIALGVLLAVGTLSMAVAIFRQPRVMHAGDMFPGRNPPLIDANNGGSALSYGRTLTQAAAIPNVDQVITGHSTVMTLADLKLYAEFNSDFAAWAQAQKKAGKTVDQAAADWRTAILVVPRSSAAEGAVWIESFNMKP